MKNKERNMRKKLSLWMLLVVMAFTSIPVGAKSFWPLVESIDIYTSSDNWQEPIASFSHGDDDVWRANNIVFNNDTEFKFKIHCCWHSDEWPSEWDEWWGSHSGSIETLKSVQAGTIVECGYDGPAFRIGHAAELSFAFSNDDLDYMQVSIDGEFNPNYFLSGEFNNWGEQPFTWYGDNEYVLDFDLSLNQVFSGQFKIIDQNYNVLGADTNDDSYVLSENNPSVTLSSSTNAKNLDLPNEAMYYFDIKDGTLTVSNWPREVLTVSIVGSTQENWDLSNATTIPLTIDEGTGAYYMENVHIPKGFRCKVLKHSSLSSVADVLYGGDRSFGQNLEVRGNNSENEFVVTDYEGEDITFTGNGTFTFTLPPDFNELHIKGTYDVVPQYFLIGEFNNWSIDTKVPFARNDDTGVSTLTYTFGGEFLITDQFGNLLGGSTDEVHWWLYENSASVDLTNDYQRKNIYVKDEGNYTLTIQQDEENPAFTKLTVSGWPVETFSAWLVGSVNVTGASEMNFELSLDNETGNYVLNATDIPAAYYFHVVKRSSLSSVADKSYGGYTDENMYSVTEETLGKDVNISQNGKDFYFGQGGTFTFTVPDNFSSIKIEGEINDDLKPSYYLIGEFNDWSLDTKVPFAKKNGITTLTYTFSGRFRILDSEDKEWGAGGMGESSNYPYFTLTENANNDAMIDTEEKKDFYVELPSEYTLTIEDSFFKITGFPTEGYYIATPGDDNIWNAEPMTKNSNGTYSIMKSFVEGDEFKFRNHDTWITNWYGGTPGGNGGPNGTYNISRQNGTDATEVPLTVDGTASNFTVWPSGAYIFVLDAGKNSLSVTGPGYALYLDDGITATGDGIVDHNGTFFATSSGQTVTLSYSGTVDPGYGPKYSVNGVPISGNTFEMPDVNVTVKAEVEKISFVVDGVTYDWSGETTVKAVSSTNTSASLVIPKTIEGYTVTAIGDEVFMDNTNLTAITIPSTVKEIGTRAFKGCSSLTVAVSRNLTLGDEAFKGVACVVASLDDNGSNTAFIESISQAGNTIIRLQNRTLYKDGEWNTICLPFDVKLEGSPLEGATAKTLTDATMTDKTVSLTFGEDVTELEAGKPYIIKWEGDGTDNIVNPMFTGVTIKLTSKSERTVERADGHVKFIGYYDAFTIDTPANDDIYYLTTGDELRHTAKRRTLKACRAYFQLSKAAAARQFVIDFGENIGLSGIIAIDNGQETDGDAVGRGAYRSGWYTLDGRRLSGRPTQHGVYVKDGKKAVMK